MALLTTLEKLESVQAAIAAIEGGAQSYSMGGRSLNRGDLKTLYERERELLDQYNKETGKSGLNLTKFEKVQ